MRKRGSSSRSPDITYLAEIVRKVGFQPSIELGLVIESEDGGDHFDMDGEDLIVEVELVPSGRLMACRVMSSGGGPDQGVWSIPPEGAEVVVAIPGGDQSEGGVILGTLSTGAVPDGLSTGNVLVRAPSGGKVFVGQVADAEPALMADAWETAFNNLLTALTTVLSATAEVTGATYASAGPAWEAAKTAFTQALVNAKTTIAKVK